MRRTAVSLTALILVLLPRTASAHIFSGAEFPAYIFSDTRFWFFLLCNGLLVTVGAWHLVRIMKRHQPAPIAIAASMTTFTFAAFMTSYVLQVFHQVEHVAQVYQYWLLQLPASQAHGIVFFADLEWNHFLFNLCYEIALGISALGFIRVLYRTDNATSFNLFVVFYPLIIQGWHVVEHSVRIMEHMRVGCSPCPGILDTLFGVPLIPLHYWFDLSMLFLQGVLFIWFGFPAYFRARRKLKMQMRLTPAPVLQEA